MDDGTHEHGTHEQGKLTRFAKQSGGQVEDDCCQRHLPRPPVRPENGLEPAQTPKIPVLRLKMS